VKLAQSALLAALARIADSSPWKKITGFDDRSSPHSSWRRAYTGSLTVGICMHAGAANGQQTRQSGIFLRAEPRYNRAYPQRHRCSKQSSSQ
jgi:hypothetical protein